MHGADCTTNVPAAAETQGLPPEELVARVGVMALARRVAHWRIDAQARTRDLHLCTSCLHAAPTLTRLEVASPRAMVAALLCRLGSDGVTAVGASRCEHCSLRPCTRLTPCCVTHALSTVSQLQVQAVHQTCSPQLTCAYGWVGTPERAVRGPGMHTLPCSRCTVRARHLATHAPLTLHCCACDVTPSISATKGMPPVLCSTRHPGRAPGAPACVLRTMVDRWWSRCGEEEVSAARACPNVTHSAHHPRVNHVHQRITTA